MPRCYMVKKALCNKYMSVARGFESWGRAGRDSSPSPTAMQLPVSPIEACTAPPVAQECPTSQLKDLRASGNSPVLESPSSPSSGEKSTCPTSASRPPEHPSTMTSTASTTCQTRPLSPPRKQQSHRETPVTSPSPSPLSTTTSRQVDLAIGTNSSSSNGSNGSTHQSSATMTTTAATTTTTTTTRPIRPSCITPVTPTIPTSAQVSVVTMHHQMAQPVQHAIHQNTGGHDAQSTTSVPIFFADNNNDRGGGPVCPGLEVLVPVQTICHLPACGVVQDIPLLRDRSAAETEAAHDLLELSRSLPPLPPPSVAVGPQNVVETPATDNVQEISIYQPAEPPPIYQLNTIDLNGSTATVYQQQHPGIIYDSVAPTSAATIVQQTPAGVFIPLSPVQEILFTYSSAPSGMPSIITTAQPAPIEAPPLTPPASECSSDIENNNPNSQPPSQSDKEVQTVIEQNDVGKAASYTYDTLLVADGRSKNKKQLGTGSNDSAEAAESAEPPEAPKAGRYVCCECGKQYATSSNLSRHKQTHRSIDSQSAKKCIHCGKAYVSMPALAMHVLTHKLTHSCGVCGKMFSRPWLLQGHLRSHTGEKPYGCAHCGKAFADRSNLRAHMQTHGSDKNYVCPKCPKSFALKSYLNKHLESACQRENCDESSNDVDTPTTYEVVPSPNSEPTSFPRMMRGVGEESI